MELNMRSHNVVTVTAADVGHVTELMSSLFMKL